MLKIITKAKEIKKCQALLENTLKKYLSSSEDEFLIGFPSGSWRTQVYFDNNSIWYSTYLIEGRRNWNGFGLAESLNQNRSNNIVVEVNTPLSGINKSVSGLFAKDDAGKIFLLHRGKIGGGRKGIGKNTFLEWYQKKPTTVVDDKNKSQPAILIGNISSKSIVLKLHEFVKDVYIFKQMVSSGEINESTYLPDEDLLKIANLGVENPKKTKSSTTTYARDPYVSEYAKRRANGKCQLCDNQAPFKNKIGRPYLETHHIIWLSKGGTDTLQNTVALYPNCHKKMHIINSKNDISKLQEIAKKT